MESSCPQISVLQQPLPQLLLLESASFAVDKLTAYLIIYNSISSGPCQSEAKNALYIKGSYACWWLLRLLLTAG